MQLCRTKRGITIKQKRRKNNHITKPSESPSLALPPFHRRGQEAQQEQQERQQGNINIRNSNGKEIQDLLKHVGITSNKALELQRRTSVSLTCLCSESQFLFNQSSLQSKRDGWSPAPIASSVSLCTG